MRRLPQEVIDIGWNELSPGFGGRESEELGLLREIYESNLEDRETALDTGFQWFNTFKTPSPQWIRSLMPLLEDAGDPLVPSLLMYLSLSADTSFPSGDATEEEVAAAMAAIRSGYEHYLKLFHLAPQWVQGLLVTCPDRAEEYLSLLFSLYESESDLAIKAGIILTLARVARKISDWRSRLVDGIREGANSALAFACAIEIIVLDGDASAPEIFDAIISTSSGDDVSNLFRRCMVRVLLRLSRERRISFLLGILRNEKYTATCLGIAKFLLESVYGQLGVVSDLPDYSSSRGWEFNWVGLPRAGELPLPAEGEEDWLGALAEHDALKREINPYRPPGDEEPTNLFELFGLPPDHAGLEKLWMGLRSSNCAAPEDFSP